MDLLGLLLRPQYMGIVLCEEDRGALQSGTRRGSGQLRLANRATVILELAQGASLAQAASRSRMHRHSAALWRDRFLAGGVKALESDLPRPGPPQAIPRDKGEAVLTLTRMTLPDTATHWSVRTMAQGGGVIPASQQTH